MKDKIIEIIYTFLILPVFIYLWHHIIFLKLATILMIILSYFVIYLYKINRKLQKKVNKATFDHDLKIFNEANELLCEEILMEYLEDLTPGVSSLHYSSNVSFFLFKFSEVGNEYLNLNLNIAFKEYYNKLEKLSGEVGCNFFPNGADNYVFHPEYRNEKDHDLYMAKLDEIKNLANQVKKSYITYRKMIKQSLFI